MNTNFSDTIAPKSDQLNADDMIVGPMSVTVKNVKRGNKEQPVVIELEGGLRPYLPCKSMRRVLIFAWGAEGAKWIGKSMTIFRDPAVKFGGVALGGIRISNLSDIDKPFTIMLTTTRSRRSGYTVSPFDNTKTGASLDHVVDAFNRATDLESLQKAVDMAAQLSDSDKQSAKEAYTAANLRINKGLKGEL